MEIIIKKVWDEKTHETEYLVKCPCCGAELNETNTNITSDTRCYKCDTRLDTYLADSENDIWEFVTEED